VTNEIERDHCFQCGREVTCSEPICFVSLTWKAPNGRSRRRMRLCCDSCVPPGQKAELRLRQCLMCQRAFAIRSSRRCCSAKCTWRWHNARRKAARAAEQSHDVRCGVCWTVLTGSRSDARTCSARCRQRLSRSRRLRTDFDVGPARPPSDGDVVSSVDFQAVGGMAHRNRASPSGCNLGQTPSEFAVLYSTEEAALSGNVLLAYTLTFHRN